MSAADVLRARADSAEDHAAALELARMPERGLDMRHMAAELRALADLVEAAARWDAISDLAHSDAMERASAADALSQASKAVERVFQEQGNE
jgi:hypothetical protein